MFHLSSFYLRRSKQLVGVYIFTIMLMHCILYEKNAIVQSLQLLWTVYVTGCGENQARCSSDRLNSSADLRASPYQLMGQLIPFDASSWYVLFKHYLSSSSQLIVALHLRDTLQNSSTPASPFSSGSDLMNVICSQWCLLWSEWPCCCFAWHERLTCAFQVPDRSHTLKCKSLPEN